MAILSHIFLFCSDAPLVCPSLSISGITKKNKININTDLW